MKRACSLKPGPELQEAKRSVGCPVQWQGGSFARYGRRAPPDTVSGRHMHPGLPSFPVIHVRWTTRLPTRDLPKGYVRKSADASVALNIPEKPL